MRLCFLGNEARREYLQQAASQGTRVERLDFEPSVGRPETIESMYEEYLLVPWTLQMVVEAERRGYDAVITGCFADPGIDACREMVRIPVIGPGEAAIHTAAMLGDCFSVLTPVESTIRPTIRQVERLGLASRLASVRPLDIPVADIRSGHRSTLERSVGLCRACAQEDRADVVVLGCGSLAHVFGDRLGETLDFPVINPLKLSVRAAEMLVGAGLTHSNRAYPTPPKLGRDVAAV